MYGGEGFSCFIVISQRNRVKSQDNNCLDNIIGCASFFQLTSQCLDIRKKLFLVFDILLVTTLLSLL